MNLYLLAPLYLSKPAYSYVGYAENRKIVFVHRTVNMHGYVSDAYKGYAMCLLEKDQPPAFCFYLNPYLVYKRG